MLHCNIQAPTKPAGARVPWGGAPYSPTRSNAWAGRLRVAQRVQNTGTKARPFLYPAILHVYMSPARPRAPVRRPHNPRF